ncbi:MAG TPA: antibiotic biosynthesis monooxygenase [Anaerolineae bacterium]|nr:antibiotic biosynthesis monooxygenase [Anaerolineae bacterium]
MFVVANRIPVSPGFEEAFEERFRNRAGLIESFPGFIRNMVLRPVDGTSDYYVIMTFWESKDAFEAWTKSEAFVEAHKKARSAPEGMFAGRNVFEMHEVIMDTGA